MSNTANILAQINEIAANVDRTANQTPDRAQNSVDRPPQLRAFDPRDPHSNETTAREIVLDRVPGVSFAIPHAQATTKGWKVSGARRPEGRGGQFVHDRPNHTGNRSYVLPAVLSGEFYVRSTKLEEPEDAETWRTDFDGSGEPPVFPNLDIILSKAESSPKEFVDCFVDEGFATSPDAVGPLAQLTQQQIQSPAVQRKLEEHPASRKILVFDVLLSYAQFSEGRRGDTLWMGCPVLPDQLLAAVQRHIAMQPGSTWQVPALDQTVGLIGEVAQITDQARGLAKSIVLNRTADWRELRGLATQGEETKEAIEPFTSLSWEGACRVADSADLPTTLRLLQQRARRMAPPQDSRPDHTVEGWRLPVPVTGPRLTPTFVLAREPADGDPKLTLEEQQELEAACKADATTQIDIGKARLLTESTGVSIITLQPGGPDISRVKMPYYAETLLVKVQDELGTCDSLRKVPLVTLAKIFSLRLTQADNFVFEHLGLLVAEDFSTEVALTKTGGGSHAAQVIKAKRHKWAAVNSMDDLLNVVEGLATCVERPHHPSLFSHQEILGLWARLKSLFVAYGGHAHIVGLFRVFKARIEEHALAVRTRARHGAEPLPPLPQLQSRSLALYNQVLEAAKQQCLRDYVALRTGAGKTAWGTRRGGGETVDADGKHGTHTSTAKTLPQRKTQEPLEVPTNTISPPAAPPAKRPTESATRQSSTSSANKRTKRPASSHPCVRCAKPGHEWRSCSEEGWCGVPQTWPGFLKSLAAKVRADHGAAVVYVSQARSARGGTTGTQI